MGQLAVNSIVVNSKLQSDTITATTSGTGALEIPYAVRSRPIVEVYSSGGTPYLVFRRDVSYWMVKDAISLVAVANTSVTLTYWYISA